MINTYVIVKANYQMKVIKLTIRIPQHTWIDRLMMRQINLLIEWQTV